MCGKALPHTAHQMQIQCEMNRTNTSSCTKIPVIHSFLYYILLYWYSENINTNVLVFLLILIFCNGFIGPDVFSTGQDTFQVQNLIRLICCLLASKRRFLPSYIFFMILCNCWCWLAFRVTLQPNNEGPLTFTARLETAALRQVLQ